MGLLVSAVFTLIVFVFVFVLNVSESLLAHAIHFLPHTLRVKTSLRGREPTCLTVLCELGYQFCLAPGKQVGLLQGVDIAGRKGESVLENIPPSLLEAVPAETGSWKLRPALTC